MMNKKSAKNLIDAGDLTSLPGLTEECPKCHGAREFVAGMKDGKPTTKPCGNCGGMGKVERDHPSIRWEQCPHCYEEIQMQDAYESWAAFDCPECGGFYMVRDEDDGPEALTEDQITF
ncbi:MAG: hypothetical protein HQL35_08225 [Alphaproteobacteria bacterium]|nr:hypothetical protein [Alphaproteobacteria bacterium]